MTSRVLTVTHVRVASRLDTGAAATWLLGFAIVAYLAMSGGGYDVVVRSEVGVALWWIVLLGAVLGVVPQRAIARPARAAIALLAALALLSGLSATWAESPERALSETARIV